MGRATKAALKASVFGLAVIISQSAIAQEVQEATRDEQTVQEIVVTAQGRAQQLQDVPIAINAVDGGVVQERAITNLETLIPQLPSVTLSESPFQKSVAIRGLGSTGGNIGYEQSAPLFVDGIFGGRGGQFNLPFFDLARVEVVRGPQAIFFGKNATAGAISIVSARPTSRFYGSLYAGYEAQNEGAIAEAIVSGPLTNTLSARLSTHYSRRGDYLFDASANRPAGGSEEFGIRGGLEWEATPSLNFYLKGEYAERDADRRFQLVCANPAFTQLTVAGVTVECREDRVITSGAAAGLFAAAFPPGSDFETSDSLNFVLRTETQLGAHQLEFTSGYSGFNTENQDGLDRSSIGLATSTTAENFDQYSQEVRLLSPTGHRIDYVFGALYINARHRVDQTVVQAVPMLVGDYVQVDQESEAFSAFGRLTWNVSDRLRISAGARFTHETKDYVSAVNRVTNPTVLAALSVNRFPAAAVAVFTQDLRRSESSFDPSLTVEWDASDDLLIYGSVARGTKAGGFEFFPRALVMPIDASRIEYEEETALNYEAGFKADLWNGTGQFNASVFYNDLKGLQNQILDIAILGFQTFNAQKAHSAGFELEGFIRPVRQLKLGGAVSYLDAEYDRFDFPARGVNFTGNRLPYAPQWSGNVYLDGDFDLSSSLELRTHVQVNHTGSMAFDASNAAVDEGRAYTTVDLRVAVGSPSHGLELALNVRNLFDEDDIRLFSNPSILSLALPAINPRGVLIAERRTIFLTVKKEF
ncbi:MAG TPA: TonB-dependent receptor [Pseudorhizobium sp.]|jgi:iron complex outermembrane receptor protein|nr:TonB-dependent receptor [Pseudorhizobium sp.]